ncbi:MAG TPA: hypothetical protein VIM53_02875 [Candidatus Saccharimonadales bacterium]
MKQQYFTQQFDGVNVRKLARRERFMRKVAGRNAHLRSSLKRSKRLTTIRAKG